MVKKAINKMFERFRNWLESRRHFIFSWYTKDSQETQEPERSLIELPTEIRHKLVEAIENLPSNPTETKAIASKVDEAFTTWHDNPSNVNNSIVILGSPITAVTRILTEALENWGEQKQISIQLLPLTARPDDIESIKSKLEHHLKCKSSDNQELEVVILPNLSWYFLRSFEGLAGIDYLRSLLTGGSENRFWIVGAGQVAWEYLNSIYTLEAYCGEVFTLPEIPPEELQAWLEPIVKEFEITFDKSRLDKQILDNDKDNKAHYFDILADIFQGVGTFALQGFLQSIRYKEDEEAETKPKSKSLVAQTPKLPKLPTLESVDRYLLYSLLLHGDLTLSTLAASLGDEEAEVQARVQVLRQQGVIEQRSRVLKVNPIYYPQLKRELAANNFIINRQ